MTGGKSLLIATMLVLAIGLASAAVAQEAANPLDLTQSSLSGIEVSGFWRHSDGAGSEWLFSVRDPTGELFSRGSAGTPELIPGTGEVQAAGTSLAPSRSLLLDASGPRSSGGPETLLVQTSHTNLVRNLGLSRLLDRLGLTDSVLLSASPSLQDFNFAYGVRRVLPPYLRFGSRRWAHYLIAEAQVERRSPEQGEPEMSMLGSVQAYWGRGWGWEGRRQSPEVMKQLAATVAVGEQQVGAEAWQGTGLIEATAAAAREVPSWQRTSSQLSALGRPVGPGSGRYQDWQADASSVKQFLEILSGKLSAMPDWASTADKEKAWSSQPQLFLQDRVAPALREQLLYGRALDLMSESETPLTRSEAFRQAKEDVTDDELVRAQVMLAVLVDAIDARPLALYHQLVTVESPAGDVPQQLREELGTAFLEEPWGPADRWRGRVLGYVGDHTILWQPRLTFSTEAAAFANSGSDSDPAASLEARLTWRPDPFQPYGVVLSHRRGKEESDRERRINWTSLEFSYRF